MTSFWAKDEERRIAARAIEEAEWLRRMADAGGIDPDQLSEQGRRILAWLTTWDEWTVGGVVELLTAAREAGRRDACPGSTSASHERNQVERMKARLAALSERSLDPPELGL